MRSLYFFFGRMNPVTKGHVRLVKEMVELAKAQGAEARIYLTHTCNHSSDPLSYNDKIRYARKVFGDLVVQSEIRDIFSLFETLQQEKFDEVHWCVGSDRIKEAARICGHNGADFNFKECTACQIVRLNEQILTEASISASVVRDFAKAGNTPEAMKWLPDELPTELKLEICNKIRDGSVQDLPTGKLTL